MTTENYYPIPPTKTQKAIICLPEEVQAWKDENQTLKTHITELEVALIDCRAEYLLLLDANPNIEAWAFDELSQEDQDRYRKDAREGLEMEEPIMKQSASKKQHKKCGNFYMDTTIDSSKTEGNKINEPIY